MSVVPYRKKEEVLLWKDLVADVSLEGLRAVLRAGYCRPSETASDELMFVDVNTTIHELIRSP